ncbi:EGF-like domain-containing protein [Entamoeba marina]
MVLHVLVVFFIISSIHAESQQNIVSSYISDSIEEMRLSINSFHQYIRELSKALKRIQKKYKTNPQVQSIHNQLNSDEKKTSTLNNIVNVDTECQGGYKVYENEEINVCSTGHVCRINEYHCDGITYNASTVLVSNSNAINCSISIIFIDENEYDISNTFGYNECVIVGLNGGEFVSQSDVTILCDQSIIINKNAFAFECINQNLVCDGKMIPSPLIELTNYSQYKNCESVFIECNSMSECHNINVNCPSEYNCEIELTNKHDCSDHCTAIRPIASCICPGDRSGTFCEDLQPINCKVSTFNSTASYVSQTNFIKREEMYPEYSLNLYQYNGNDITFTITLDCKNNETYNDSFTNWLDSEYLVLSLDPQLQLSTEIINFNMFYDRKDNTSVELGKTQLIGDTIEITLLSNVLENTKAWNGDLLYVEVLISPHLISTNQAIHKFYIQRDYTEKEYNKSNFFTSHWIAIVSIVLVLFFIAFVCFWYVFQYNKTFVHVKEQ